MKQLTLITLAVSFLLLSGCTVELPDLFSQTAKEWFELGQGYQVKEDYETARRCYENVMVVYPSSKYADDAQFNLGMAYYNDELYIEAQAMFEDLAASYPNSELADNARYYIGRCYFMRTPDYQRDTELLRAASAEYRRTLKLFPGTELASDINSSLKEVAEIEARKLDQIIYIYRRIDKQLSVIYYADKLLAEYPESVYAAKNLWRRGEALRSLGRNEEARADYQRILDDYPNHDYASDARSSLAAL